MGRVLAYRDRALDRPVAVKVSHKDDASARGTLFREASVIGRLEHPHIIPVYDIGEDEEWGAFYVMRLLEQPSLEHALGRLRDGESEHSHGRLLRFFIQVCEAVDFAHSRGFVHCDLKPENILLGSFGEVFVVDWGLAFEMGKDRHPRGGTPGFMPPEQLAQRADEIDPRTDVFALGAILYQILTDERPFPSVGFTQWRMALPGEKILSPPRRPSELRRDRSVPAELEEVCMRALALDKEERLGSARELARALDAFLEGTKAKKRRERRAAGLTEQASGLAESYRELLALRSEALDAVTALRAVTAPWDRGEDKEALWEAEERCLVFDALASRTFHSTVSTFEQALDEVPEHGAARRALAELYWAELARPERAADVEAQRTFESLALDHDDGHLRRVLDDGAKVTLVAKDATIVLEQLGEVGLRHIAVRTVAEGPSPLGPLAVPGGVYQARVRFAGGPDRRAPFRVVAGDVVEIDLGVLGASLDPNLIPVPAGHALLGGHESSAFGEELRSFEVGAFLIARSPVTFASYLEWIDELLVTAASAGELRTPRAPEGEPYWRREGSRWEPDRILAFGVEREGLLQLPAVGVTVGDARAFADWQAERSGLPYRLPTSVEWEKAARGVDGRRYPWGHRFDATFCCMRDARPAPARLERSGQFPEDESPYGVMDLAGGVADWVDAPSAHRAIARGGAWCDWPADGQLAAEKPYRAEERSPRVGFRLACSVPSGPVRPGTLLAGAARR